MAKQEWTVEDSNHLRLDKFLSENSELSRTRVQELAKAGEITVNGKTAKSSAKLNEGDIVACDVPEDEPIDVKPENIPLDILYEDEDIIVINKPKGMVVHPAPGNYSGTLVNALLYHCKDLSGINGKIRPGIVHRIDKDTTGCIVACKNDKAHTSIAKQLEDKTCHREYLAVVNGIIDSDAGKINAPIGRDVRDRQRMTVTQEHGKDAVTHFVVKERFKDSTYIECRLETGRTHQIRVHMKYMKHPIMGDVKYGGTSPYMDTEGQVLHAYQLTLVHPRTGKTMTFEAPLPEYFQKLLTILREENRQ
jgi:23S rRNA pseudouridine1911/1915/1917 synthase